MKTLLSVLGTLGMLLVLLTATAGAAPAVRAGIDDPLWAWERTAEDEEEIGSRHSNSCNALGSTAFEPDDFSVWGVDTYTSDSSICAAAVHAGKITFNRGGYVEYEIRPGLDSYAGSIRNGVTSDDYGSYDYSFVFVGAKQGADRMGNPRCSPITCGIPRGLGLGTAVGGWTFDARHLRALPHRRFVWGCFPPARNSKVWGTDTYTDDSSVCMAGVHAGKIDFNKGGFVVIEIRAGLPSYRGTTRNTVSSRSFGRWPGSFTVVAGYKRP